MVGTPEFVRWYMAQDATATVRIDAAVSFLEEHGPQARRPYVGTITGSRHQNMKELRTGSIRILFAFDPAQQAILLLGADKAAEGWNAWYRRAIPEADRLFDAWLADPTYDDD